MFAAVAVNTAAHGGGTAYPTDQAGEESLFPGPVFHYHIPPQLKGQVAPRHTDPGVLWAARGTGPGDCSLRDVTGD